MKKLFFFLCSIITLQASAQSEFVNLTTSTDSTYGYTVKNPMRMKNGSVDNSVIYAEHFLMSLKKTNDESLQFIYKGIAKDPDHKDHAFALGDAYTNKPLTGKGGILDAYHFVSVKTRDSITIYVDSYHKAALYIPMGLKYVKKY